MTVIKFVEDLLLKDNDDCPLLELVEIRNYDNYDKLYDKISLSQYKNGKNTLREDVKYLSVKTISLDIDTDSFGIDYPILIIKV